MSNQVTDPTAERNTKALRVRLPPSLLKAVTERAGQMGLNRSAYVRFILKFWCAPDKTTVECCAEARADRLVDERTKYTTEDAG